MRFRPLLPGTFDGEPATTRLAAWCRMGFPLDWREKYHGNLLYPT
jgi:hypothetical protein